MDRSEWDKILTRFQASARGYLVRNEVRRAREDFEDIAREIDGGSTHVVWRETVIPIPHFADIHQESPFLRPSCSVKGLDVCARLQSPTAAAAAAAPSSEERGDHHVLLGRIEAERDDSQIKGLDSLSEDCLPSSSVRERQRESTIGDKDGGVMESTGDNTSVWSSLELDINFDHSHRGSRQHCLAQEVPCTPEALRLHRNTLTMELLWLQQAIDSRKKYLSLKDRLSVS